MKIITLLIYILAISPAYAKIYKCIDNGNTSYQQTQCKQTGSEFTLGKDISLEQQQAASKKLATDLEKIAEKKKQQKENNDKERLIRAEEENARATFAQAEQTARQTEALENNHKQPINQPSYLLYPPAPRPLPKHPIAKPLHQLPVITP